MRGRSTGVGKRGPGVWERIVRLVCAITLVAGYIPMTVQSAYAASDVAGGADSNPALYLLNDHTPYAIHFTMTGLSPDTTLNVNVRLSKTGIAGGFSDARGFTWNPTISRWVQTREDAVYFPSIKTDATGGATGWVYWKVGDESFTGFGPGYAPLLDNQGYLTVSLQLPAGGSTFNGLGKVIVTVVDADTQGAWVHDGVATGAQANKRAEALKSDDASMSYSLQKTEANLLDDDSNGVVDDENYGPAGATGDFRFGVPAASTMNIRLNNAAWATGQGVTAGPADTDIAVGAADMVAPSTPGVLSATPHDSSVDLAWGASTDGGSGLSGYAVYRMVPGTFGDLALQTAVPRRIATVAAGTTTYTDATAVNGNTYTYLVRAIDVATNVSARSNSADAVLPVPDTTDPAAVTDLASTGVGATSVDLQWTAPGDDGAVGTAASYEVRYSTSPIIDVDTFLAATPVSGVPAPQAAGSIEHLTVDGLVTGTPYYFALVTIDEANNVSGLSNVITATPQASPEGSMQINDGAVVTSSTAVTIGSDVAGAVDMRLREAGGEWSAWVPYAASLPFTLSTGDGLKTVEAEYRNAVAMVTPLSDTITLDTAAPTGTMALAAGASYTTTRVVNVDSDVTGAVEMRKRNVGGGGNWGAWTAYSVVATHQVSSGDGLKTVETEYRDAAGNVLALSDTITLDTVAPSGTMALNAGASYTTTRNVSIDSAVTGAVEMRKRNVGGGGNWGSWTAYSDATAHQVSSGDGLKTVETEYRDAAGNVLPLSDTITLDTVAPTGTMSVNGGVSYTSSRDVTVGSDVTGASEMRLRDATGSWSGWSAYAASAPLQLSAGEGLKTVEAEYRDAAGLTLALSDTITVDTLAPTGTMSLDAGAAYTTDTGVTLGSEVTGAADIRVREAGGAWSDWTAYVSSMPFVLSAGDGLKTVEAEYRSVGGNIGALSDTIVLDSTKPVTGDDAVARYAGSATIVLTPSDGSGSGVAATWYRFDDGLWTQGTEFTTALTGDHTLEFYSTDAAGNIEDTQSVDFLVSEGAPATSLFGVPSDWVNRAVTFSFIVDGDAPAFTTYYRLGDGADTTYTAPVRIETEGTTQLTYWSKDGLGQIEDASHATIRIDLTDPTASHVAQDLYTDGTAEIALTGSDALSYGGLAWTVDGGAVTTTSAATANVVVSVLGAHTLTYRAFDLAGNESDPVDVDFTVKAPVVLALETGSTTLEDYGDSCAIAGTLTVDGEGVGNLMVVLQSSSDDRTFVDSGIAGLTDKDGSFVLTATPRSRTYYRVRFAATDEYVGAVTRSISVMPRAKVSTPVAPKVMSRNGWRTVYGYLWPRHTSGSTSAVRLYRWRYVNGSWKQYGSYLKVAVHNHSTYSAYSISVRLPYAGKWRLRALAPADSTHAAAWSSGYDYVTVR